MKITDMRRHCTLHLKRYLKEWSSLAAPPAFAAGLCSSPLGAACTARKRLGFCGINKYSRRIFEVAKWQERLLCPILGQQRRLAGCVREGQVEPEVVFELWFQTRTAYTHVSAFILRGAPLQTSQCFVFIVYEIRPTDAFPFQNMFISLWWHCACPQILKSLVSTKWSTIKDISVTYLRTQPF